MKPKTLRLILAVVTSASVLLTGCVDVTDYHYVDAPRTPVKFETPKAQQIFYDAVLAKYIPDDGVKGRISGNVLPYWHDSVTFKSSNVVFNAAVAVADANHDGTITVSEAEAFAAAVGARSAKQKEADVQSIRSVGNPEF